MPPSAADCVVDEAERTVALGVARLKRASTGELGCVGPRNTGNHENHDAVGNLASEDFCQQ